jgi:hypothetical protein
LTRSLMYLVGTALEDTTGKQFYYCTFSFLEMLPHVQELVELHDLRVVARRNVGLQTFLQIWLAALFLTAIHYQENSTPLPPIESTTGSTACDGRPSPRCASTVIQYLGGAWISLLSKCCINT